jgi:hypothetical protein
VIYDDYDGGQWLLCWFSTARDEQLLFALSLGWF